MALLKDWNQHVSSIDQLDPGENIGKFIEGETIALAAGPPVFDPNNLDSVSVMHLVGLCQSIGVTQGQQAQRVFELGSRRSFIVPGRSAGSLVISKLWINGHSLLGSLYRAVSDAATEEALYRKPGYNYKYTNLQSELFHRPVGILIMVHDQNDDMVSASFYECCYISSSNWGTSAAGLTVASNVRVEYEEEYPIDPGTIETEV